MYRSFFFILFFFLKESSCFGLVESYPWTQVQFDWQDAATLLILSLTLLSMILEVRPPDISMLLGVFALLILGILDVKEFLEGFSHDLLFTLALLCVVVRAIEINGVFDFLAKKILAQGKSLPVSLLQLLAPLGVVSAFLLNTPLVLRFTPKIHFWAKTQGFASSQFLIPISYITTLGGMCTLMGTTTNLVVEEAVRRTAPQSALSFFEFAYVGVPLFILGLLCLLTIGVKFIPKREDPLSKAQSESRSYTAEFQVLAGSPLVGKTLKEAGKTYFLSEMVVQIGRKGRKVDSPPEDTLLLEGDRLVFAGEINQIADLHRIEGLRSEADPHFSLDSTSPHFAEVVISPTSSIVGKTLRQVYFRSQWKASCLAIYRQGERVAGNVGNIPLLPGDVLILLSNERWENEKGKSEEFYSIAKSQKLSSFKPVKASLVAALFAGMVGFAAAGFSLSLCVLATTALLIGFGLISIQEAKKSILWSTLLLIGCSIAMAQALVKTGIAASLASYLLSFVGTNPNFIIEGILLTAILCTEFLPSSAAALLLFPIALNLVHLAGYTSPEAVKTVGIALAIGCSAGFAMPFGSQANLIVYSQGGYRFTDFFRIGILLDILILVIASVMVPWIWPLEGAR